MVERAARDSIWTSQAGRLSSRRRRVRTSRPGFTLLELLVVLFIVGLGWFTFLPKLDMSIGGGAGGGLDSVNKFLGSVKEQAERTYSVQKVSVPLGGAALSWGDKVQNLPTPILSCRLPDQVSYLSSTTFFLEFYPDGHCSRAILALEGGEVFVLDPLTAVFRNAVAEAVGRP